MFENPHIIYVISKQKHEELIAECKMIRMAKYASKSKKEKKQWCCKIMLFIADIFIKIGISIKKRWMPVGSEAVEAVMVLPENE